MFDQGLGYIGAVPVQARDHQHSLGSVNLELRAANAYELTGQ